MSRDAQDRDDAVIRRALDTIEAQVATIRAQLSDEPIPLLTHDGSAGASALHDEPPSRLAED